MRSFRHCGLARWFRRGDGSRLPPAHFRRITVLLFALRRASRMADLNGLARLHPLRGDRFGYWAMRVSGNWRIVFRFEDGDVWDVDLVDYH
ncbi:MAG: type II toxin-antitoxin system RelE/ParE family toxin [Bryobacterales bacterium]|nr:type II toxin-antitoxin system RelE/ParE family toxin [Bryobacterales bacterium]